MSEIQSIWTSFSTIRDIVSARGYDTSGVTPKTEQQFYQKFGSQNPDYIKKNIGFVVSGVLRRDSVSPKKISVVWSTKTSISHDVKMLSIEMLRDNISDAILVYDYLTARANQIFKYLTNLGCFVDCYNFYDSLFDISKHQLVPLHEITSKEESDKLMKTCGLTKNEMPSIKRTDPMCRHLGARPGDIIKITRESEIAPSYFSIYYRKVI